MRVCPACGLEPVARGRRIDRFEVACLSWACDFGSTGDHDEAVIIDRLCAKVRELQGAWHTQWNDAENKGEELHAALAWVRELQGELAEARQQLTEYRQLAEDATTSLTDERDAARADALRLREALERIASCRGQDHAMEMSYMIGLATGAMSANNLADGGAV